MRPEHRRRWEKEIHKVGDLLRTPRDLLLRKCSSDDFVDSATIGGVAVADIISGKISESQIPHDVVQAFHSQYPQYGSSFIEAVHKLSAHPDALQGLVNGIKGKLFEIDYVEWLNHGHLPLGYTASLAEHANNPAWDVVIHDSHGHIDHLLQLKATESLSYVREAIEAHPSIDVVVPHEVYDKLAGDPATLSHMIDSHQHLDDMTGHVSDATDHATAAADHFGFHIPVIALAFAVGQNYLRYRQQKITLAEAVRNTRERGVLAIVATSAGWAVSALAHRTYVGAPVAVAVRLFGRQFFHNLRRRGHLADSITLSRRSIHELYLQTDRPLLAE